MTLVAVNSLSKLGQNRWKEREKLKEMAETAADLPEEETKGQDPWYVNADYEWLNISTRRNTTRPQSWEM